MGMYTELIFGASLKQDTPEDVINTLRRMVGQIDEPITLDFGSGRNPLIGCSSSFGAKNSANSFTFDKVTKQWSLCTRANIKNYDSDIEGFLEWIKPFIDSGSGYNDLYAITIYEQDTQPTLYFLNNFFDD